MHLLGPVSSLLRVSQLHGLVTSEKAASVQRKAGE